MKLALVFFPIFIAIGCGQPPAKIHFGSSLKQSYFGLLHANSCMGGASYLVYNEKHYAFGSKSIAQLNETVSAIGQGQPVSGELLESSGCEKVYQIEFSGEFEKENALTGYDNDEVRQVVQVYQFRLL